MDDMFQKWSRRKFITSATAAGGLLALSPHLSWAASYIDPKIAAIVAKTIGIDTHNHIDVPLKTDELPGPIINLAAAMKTSGLSAICMTFAVDYQQLKNEGEAYERFLNGLIAMDKILADNRMKRALNGNDILDSHAKHTPTVIQSVEGAHFLEGHIDRLEVAYKRGLRHLTLLHDNDASVPLGDVFTNQSKFGGLTSFGADVLKECNRLGILVDLSHGTNEMVNASLKITDKPIIISHTGLDTQFGKEEFMNKMMLPRLISKEQAKIVAENGGVIGVWTHLADSPLAYAENIRAMVDVVGINHVCIGTDTKLTPAYQSPTALNPHQKQKNNTDKNNNQPRKNGGSNELWANQQFGFYYTVVEAMLKTGFTEEEIIKIGGKNYYRLFDAATKG